MVYFCTNLVLISVNKVFQAVQAFTYLVKFIPKYFMFFYD